MIFCSCCQLPSNLFHYLYYIMKSVKLRAETFTYRMKGTKKLFLARCRPVSYTHLNQFSQLLSELSKDKIILLSTHIVSDVEAIADQIMIMKKGCLIAHDTPQKLLSVLDGRVKERQVSQRELEQLRGNAVICYQRASTPVCLLYTSRCV